MFVGFPLELNKVAADSIDAAHSISRHISETITYLSPVAQEVQKQ
jgi:hypothetical protein